MAFDLFTGIKTAFTGGELAPSLYSRIDLSRYTIGAKRLRNFIVHPHGSISNRPGLEYIATEKTANKKIRLIPFEFSTTQTYVLEFGDYYVRFYTNGAQIYDDDSYDAYTKLLMHCNASPFTDEIGKTITAGEAIDAYTKLLLHCDGDDESTTFTDMAGKTVTAGGTAQVDTAQKVFGTGSALLDGDSDYLRLADSDDWTFADGDFGISMRMRADDLPTDGNAYDLYSQYVDADNYIIIDFYNSSGTYYLRFAEKSGGTTVSVSGAVAVSADTWYHVEVNRNSTTVYLSLDGVEVSNTTTSKSFANLADYLYIGARDGSSRYFKGWIDEVIVKKGTYLHSSGTFTSPAVAYGAAATCDTSDKKFGAGSLFMYGTGGYLYTADSADFNFGVGNFSIDMQAYWESRTGKQCFISQYQDADNYWILGKNADDTLYMIFKYAGTVAGYYYTTAAPSLSDTTWYHVEFTRSGSNAYIFVDGVSQPLTASVPFGSSDVGNITGNVCIGYNALDKVFFNGNLDEIRVSKGVARHTADFTAPTDAYAAGTIYEVVTPYSEDDIADLYYTQSADVIYLTHPSYAPRQLERHGNTDWELNAYAYENGPFQLPNTDATKTLAASAVTGVGITLTASGWTFNTLHDGALFKSTHYIEGQSTSLGINETESTSSVSCGGTWRLITHGTWTATIQVEKSTDGGSTWTMLREFSSADDYNASTYGTEDMSDYAEPFLVRVTCTAFTSGTCNVNLTTDPYYHDGICLITAVAVGGATATATVIRDLGSTDATVDWAEGSWSDYAGWPAVVEFHPEDRLMFGNTTTEPSTYWLTQTGDYTNFARSTPLVDSDAISSPLPSRKVNGINGFVPLSEMIALTLSNEVSVRSSSGPLTPTTAYNKVHGWEGSYGTRPVVIGNRAVYVQSTGSIVRDIGYDLYMDSFVGSDLTIFSNHLFTGYSISDMAYQQNPDRILWIVRSDGKLLSLTYMREQEVVAWSWHDTNDGTDTFESVCCVRGTGYDEVWFSVNRGGTRYIERMKQRMASTALEDQFFVDCGYTYDSTATTTVTGLDHLEGKTVAILADGVVLDQQVVTSGEITLDTAASVVQVGLPYNSDLETLNVEVNLQDGTTQGRQVKISQVVFRLLNSKGGYLGPDSSNLYALSYSARADYDSTVLFSGEVPETLSGGYSEGGRLFFRQSDPLPVTIAAIIPSVTVGGATQSR